MGLAVLADVLEQLTTGQVAAASDDGRQPSVPKANLVHLPGLAAEAERHRRAPDPGMAVVERRQTEAPVQARVLVVADADQRQLQQPNDRGEHLLARQAGPGEVVVDPLADRRQRASEGDQPLELGGITPRAVPRVVAVLLAARGLEMAVRPGRDPDVRPGRRDHDLADPLEDFRVADRPAVGIAVGEAAAGPPAGDARAIVAGVAEAGNRRRVGRHRGDVANELIGPQRRRSPVARTSARPRRRCQRRCRHVIGHARPRHRFLAAPGRHTFVSHPAPSRGWPG